ncbi:hypothetical protein Zmor_014969 [Zophobas morio]|uniref:CCHC-type domain-containing protein n=1 Tax=Zophobas morio TaxID=2755281 RepID=A0AA38ILN8_9CUCU|nr:hypothetical protein Zmor_014969 [Zophobas morio]
MLNNVLNEKFEQFVAGQRWEGNQSGEGRGLTPTSIVSEDQELGERGPKGRIPEDAAASKMATERTPTCINAMSTAVPTTTSAHASQPVTSNITNLFQQSVPGSYGAGVTEPEPIGSQLGNGRDRNGSFGVLGYGGLVDTPWENPPRTSRYINDQPVPQNPSDIQSTGLMQYILEQNRKLMDLVERSTAAGEQGSTRGNSGGLPNYQVMPDFSKSVEKFDGEDLSRSGPWLKKISATARLHHWPSEFTFETARTQLVGPARLWYESKRERIRSWEEFELAFRSTFVREHSQTQLWKAMSSRVQSAQESTNLYFHDKVRLCSALKLSFTETKEQLAVDLLSKELATMLMSKTHTDEDDLFRDFIVYERLVAERRARHKVDRFVPLKPSTPSTMLSPIKTEKRWLPGRDNAGRPLCFRCREYGHIAAACQSKRHPETCESRPEQTRATEPKKRVHRVEKSLTSRDTVARTFLINDRDFVTGLVDTGSAVCTVKRSVTEKCGLKPVKFRQNLYAFGSVTTPALTVEGRVKVRLAVDEVTVNDIELLVVPNDSQDCDLLVGRPFTERKEIAYMRKGDWIAFGYSCEAPFKNIDVEALVREPGLETYELAKGVTVAPHESKMVPVKKRANNYLLRVYNLTSEEFEKQSGEAINEDEVVGDVNAFVPCTRITASMVKMGEGMAETMQRKLLERQNEIGQNLEEGNQQVDQQFDETVEIHQETIGEVDQLMKNVSQQMGKNNLRRMRVEDCVLSKMETTSRTVVSELPGLFRRVKFNMLCKERSVRIVYTSTTRKQTGKKTKKKRMKVRECWEKQSIRVRKVTKVKQYKRVGQLNKARQSRCGAQLLFYLTFECSKFSVTNL